MNTFRLSVVARARPQIDFEAICVSVPAQTGALGVCYGHLPLLTILKVGLVHIIESGGKERWFGITGGFFEMMGDHATLLADELIDETEAGKPNPAFDTRPALFHPSDFPGPMARLDFVRSMLRRSLEKNRRTALPSPK